MQIAWDQLILGFDEKPIVDSTTQQPLSLRQLVLHAINQRERKWSVKEATEFGLLALQISKPESQAELTLEQVTWIREAIAESMRPAPLLLARFVEATGGL